MIAFPCGVLDLLARKAVRQSHAPSAEVLALMDISHEGWVRFAHSKGEAVESMKGSQTMPVISRVDVSKGSVNSR